MGNKKKIYIYIYIYRERERERAHGKENNHTHKTKFTWFGNLSTSTKLQGFHYYQGKYKVRLHCFSLLKDDNNNKTQITKTSFFYILCTKFIMGYKTGQKMRTQAWANKPPLHGLSLSKSPIKNHATLFESSRQSDQTQTRLHKAQQAQHFPPKYSLNGIYRSYSTFCTIYSHIC